MARPPILKTGAMSPAKRQQRWRAKVRRAKRDAPKLAKLEAQRQHRAEREVALGARIRLDNESLGSRLYGIVYMDPASRFEVWNRETGLDRAADNHYPTEGWKEIASRPPPLTDDGILFCWSTRPQLMNTCRMIEDRWGFEYKTCMVWAKEGRGTGHIVIDNAEILIIASRGKPVWPAPGTQDLALQKTASEEPWEGLFPPAIETPRGRHSEKPEIFAEMIERLWPNTPRLEMYYEPKEHPEQRAAHLEKRKAAGWDLWPPVAEDQ